MPGRCRLFADSPPSTMRSSSSALWTTAIARIFSACASSETPRSACLSVETRTYPIAFIAHMLALEGADCKSIFATRIRNTRWLDRDVLI